MTPTETAERIVDHWRANRLITGSDTRALTAPIAAALAGERTRTIDEAAKILENRIATDLVAAEGLRRFGLGATPATDMVHDCLREMITVIRALAAAEDGKEN